MQYPFFVKKNSPNVLQFDKTHAILSFYSTGKSQLFFQAQHNFSNHVTKLLISANLRKDHIINCLWMSDRYHCRCTCIQPIEKARCIMFIRPCPRLAPTRSNDYTRWLCYATCLTHRNTRKIHAILNSSQCQFIKSATLPVWPKETQERFTPYSIQVNAKL